MGRKEHRASGQVCECTGEEDTRAAQMRLLRSPFYEGWQTALGKHANSALLKMSANGCVTFGSSPQEGNGRKTITCARGMALEL